MEIFKDGLSFDELLKIDNLNEMLEKKIIEESMIAEQKDRCTNYDFYKNQTKEEIDKEIEEDWKKLEQLFGEDYKTRSFKEEFKGFSNLWDRIIDWSINTGNSHYGFTINIIDTISELTMNKEEYKEFVENFIDALTNYLKTVTYIMVVPEYNKKGKLHFHGIIFLKNVMDYNKNIRNNISNFLKENMRPGKELNYHGYPEFGKPPYDIKVDYLKNFLDIKKWNMYLYKQHSKWNNNNPAYYCPDITFIEKWEQNVLGYTDFSLLKIVLMVYKIYQDRYEYTPGEKNNGWQETYKKKQNIYNITGIKIVKNEISDSLIIDIMLNYLLMNRLYIYKSNVYKKLEKFNISYERIGSTEEILYYKFKENVIGFFRTKFMAQFENFNIYYLIKENFKNVELILKKVESITSLKISPKMDIMEFKDGIYLIKYNVFILKKYTENLEISTIKCYEKNYDTLRKKSPKTWIKNLLKALDFKGNINALEIFKDINEGGIKIENINDLKLNYAIKICIFIAKIFQDKTDNKKKFLYIYGKTSTGKTTLITNVLFRFFGEENIGTSTSDRTFKFQDIVGKIIVIIDEFVYDENLKGDLLKLLGGEKLLISKKYEKEHKTIQILCGIILSNSLMYDENYKIDEALKARVDIIEFLQQIGVDNDRDKLLKEEEPEIILFCNKLYFALNPKKYNKIKSKTAFKMIQNNK